MMGSQTSTARPKGNTAHQGGSSRRGDPFATEPTAENQWVKEGPHLMIVVPDPATLEGISTNPEDPVYAMWKGTPYAHIMVKVADQEGG
jgi:hypothetical protein